jgi:hypothetical protein
MIALLIKLGTLQKVSQLALLLSAKLMPIAFLFIGFGFIDVSVIAQTESENSSDIFSKPIRVDVQEEKDETEAQPVLPPDLSSESKKNNPPRIGDIIEVNPRSEQWENIHTGDLSTGTIKFRFNK